MYIEVNENLDKKAPELNNVMKKLSLAAIRFILTLFRGFRNKILNELLFRPLDCMVAKTHNDLLVIFESRKCRY